MKFFFNIVQGGGEYLDKAKFSSKIIIQGHFNVEERSREMSWEEEGEDSTEEEDNLSAVSMSTVF